MMAPAIPANNNDDLDPYLLALITLHLPGARAPLASEFPPSQRVALRYLGSRPGAALVSWPAAGPTARDPVRTTWVTPDGALDARCGALDRDLTTLGASPLLERQTRRDLAPSSPPVPAATLRRPQFSRRLPPRTGHGLDRLAAAALDLPPSRAGLVITTLTDGDEPLDANLPMAAQLLHLYLPAAPSCGHVARRIEPYAANLARRNVRRFFIAMDGTREAIADSIMIGEAVLPAVDRILDLASEMERQGIFELDLDDDGHDADDGMDPINGILDSDQAQPIGGGGLRALVPLRFSGVRNHAIAAAANTDDNDSADDDADDAMDVDDNTDHHGGAPPDLSDVVARLHTRIEGIAARAMLDNPDLVADGHAGMLDIQTLSNTESFNAPPSRLGSPVPPLQTTELASATDAIAALPTPVPPLPGSMPEPAVVEDPFAVPFTPRDALERLKQHVDARRLALVEQYRWTCAAPSSASGRMRLEHRIRAIAQTDLPRLMDKVIERCATWKDLEQYQAALDPLLDEWARGIARLEGPMRPVGDSESSDASDAIDSVDEWSDVGDNDDGDGEDTSTTKNSDGNDKDEEDDHDDDTKSVLSDSNFIVPDDVGGSQTADPYMSPSLVVEADSRQRQLIRTLRVLLEQPAESAKAQVALLADVDKTMAALAAAPSGSLPPTNLQAYLALHAAHQMSIQRLTERASSKSRKQVRHALRVDPLTTFRLLRKEAWTETVEAMWAAIESFDSAEAALKQEKAAVKAAKATAGSGGGGGSAAATGAGSSSGNSIGSGAPRPMQTSPGNKAIQGAVSSPKVNLPSTEPILISDSESSSDDESRDPAFVLDGSTSPPIRIPALLAGILKPHQLEGVRFLWQRIHKDGGGAILAHQMGVGKTLQVIAFLYCTFRAMQVFPHKFSSQMRTRRVIVLCPKSVVTNWIDEVHKWIPAKQQAKSDFHVYKFDHANLTARHDCVRKWHETGGILVASYGMFCVTLQTRTTAKRAPTAEEERLCAEMKAMTISSASIVVFDEAHTIKNPDTILATVIKSGLHENAARIALTGTPLQNNLEEYYTLSDIVAPGYLGNPSEFKRIKGPIMASLNSDATRQVRKRGAKAFALLARLLDEFVSRVNFKVLVKELSEVSGVVLTENVVRFDLTPMQREFLTGVWTYAGGVSERANHLSLVVACAQIFAHPCIWWHNESQKHQLTIADTPLEGSPPVGHGPAHPQAQLASRGGGHNEVIDMSLLDDDDSDDDAAIQSLFGPNSAANQQRSVMTGGPEPIPAPSDSTLASRAVWMNSIMAKYTDPEASVHSAKVEALLSLVQGAFALGEKTLVFSKFVLVLDFLAAKLDEHNIVYRALTGRLNAEKRDEAIRSFNSDPSIALFLISTTAGSTGINLTAASRVIIFDNGWNPVHEEQAIGRAYRMGQTRPVHVYRFIAEDTVEEGLFKAQVQKQLLARQALDAENLKSEVSRKAILEAFKQVAIEARVSLHLPRVNLEGVDMSSDPVLTQVCRDQPLIVGLDHKSAYFPPQPEELSPALRKHIRERADNQRMLLRSKQIAHAQYDLLDEEDAETAAEVQQHLAVAQRDTVFSEQTMPNPEGPGRDYHPPTLDAKPLTAEQAASVLDDFSGGGWRRPSSEMAAPLPLAVSESPLPLPPIAAAAVVPLVAGPGDAAATDAHLAIPRRASEVDAMAMPLVIRNPLASSYFLAPPTSAAPAPFQPRGNSTRQHLSDLVGRNAFHPRQQGHRQLNKITQGLEELAPQHPPSRGERSQPAFATGSTILAPPPPPRPAGMPQIVTHNPSAFGKSMIAHPSATSLATLASPAVDQIDLTYPTTDSDADDNSKSAAAAGKNRTKRAVEGGSQLSSSPLGSSSSGGGGGGPARLPAPHPPGTARTLPEPIPAAASRKTPWHPTGHRTIGLLPPVPSPGLISLGGSTAVPLPVKRKRTVSAGFLGGGTPRSGAPPPPLTQLPSLSAAGDVAPAPKRMRRSSTIAAMTATTGATTTAVVTASSGGGECGSGPLRSGSPSPTTSSSEQQQGAVPKPARTKRRLRTKDQGGKRQ